MSSIDRSLPDSEIDLLENEIPRLAVEATSAAYRRAVAAGLTVLVARGANLVEVSEAENKIVGAAPSRHKVRLGKVIKVRQLPDA